MGESSSLDFLLHSMKKSYGNTKAKLSRLMRINRRCDCKRKNSLV